MKNDKFVLLPFIAALMVLAAVLANSPAYPGQVVHRPRVEKAIFPLQSAEDSSVLTNLQVEDFLAIADVTLMKTVQTGVTRPKKVLLERPGSKMHAIFRDVEIHKTVWRDPNVGPRVDFRDSCVYEVAAYKLAVLLGIDNVPPVVRRTIQGKRGTLQFWIEDAMTEKARLAERKIPPDYSYWSKQFQLLRLFDQLIYNDDRNPGNILIDSKWKVWFIDHTRSFRTFDELPDSPRILSCETNVWNKLQDLTDDQIRAELDPFLRIYELEGLLKRRVLLVQQIKTLIAEQGEGAVIFTWD